MPKSKHISRRRNPPPPPPPPESDDPGYPKDYAQKGFRISFAMLGGLATALGLIIGMWQIAARVATKSDVEMIAAQLGPRMTQTEARVRDLEIAMARQFGASPTSIRPSISASPMRRAFLQLAQYVGQMPPNMAQVPPIPIIQRPVVVPRELIERYKLQPSRGGVYALLGEDGRIYSLDEVIAVLIRLHMRGM